MKNDLTKLPVCMTLALYKLFYLLTYLLENYEYLSTGCYAMICCKLQVRATCIKLYTHTYYANEVCKSCASLAGVSCKFSGIYVIGPMSLLSLAGLLGVENKLQVLS